MNQILYVAGIIIVGFALFASGFAYGIHYYNASLPSTPALLQQASLRAIEAQHVLETLDEEKIQQAKGILAFKIDAEILIIDSLSKYADREMADRSRGFLAKVAEHRKKYPVEYEYNGIIDPGMAEIKAEINRILKRAELREETQRSLQSE